MKTIKLADSEWVTLKEAYLYHPIFPNKEGLLDVDNVDEFRKFLNDEIKNTIELKDLSPNAVFNSFDKTNNLKSILSKLDKESNNAK